MATLLFLAFTANSVGLIPNAHAVATFDLLKKKQPDEILSPVQFNSGRVDMNNLVLDLEPIHPSSAASESNDKGKNQSATLAAKAPVSKTETLATVDLFEQARTAFFSK